MPFPFTTKVRQASSVLNKNPIHESGAALWVSLCHIAHGATCVRGIPCSSKYCANPRVFIFLNTFHPQFRLHKGFLEYEGALEFDHHFKDVIGISPCDWQLKLQIACDLALALDQCHVRCSVIFECIWPSFRAEPILFCSTTPLSFCSRLLLLPFAGLQSQFFCAGSVGRAFRFLFLQYSLSDRATALVD